MEERIANVKPERRKKSEAGFVPVSGMKLVFDPASYHRCGGKKNPCPDCHFCQQCGDARCAACRTGKSPGGARAKLSMSEQIELYEAINSGQCRLQKEPEGD